MNEFMNDLIVNLKIYIFTILIIVSFYCTDF